MLQWQRDSNLSSSYDHLIEISEGIVESISILAVNRKGLDFLEVGGIRRDEPQEGIPRISRR
jgi:Ni,Fe-hydrogenase III large subunit